MAAESQNDLEVLMEIIASLKKLSKEDQERTLKAVATFLNLSSIGNGNQSNSGDHFSGASAPSTSRPAFAEDRTISPKDFMRDKSPKSDIERVVCLAYFLTHYRDTAHFKTLDISALNTDAAQPKFSNASAAIENAARAGFLVQAAKGTKQISAAGELYVQHLPDRDAAKSGVQGMKPKQRKPRKPLVKKPSSAPK